MSTPAALELKRGLVLMGFPEYYDTLTINGIDTLGKLLELRKEHFDGLVIKSMHHETLLRAISFARLAVISPTAAGVHDSESGRREKRKYQRHAKKDQHAPQIPPTAYVVFSNEYRAGVDDPTAFTEIAKAVGKAWKALSEEERTKREEDARTAKEQYRMQMAAYKQTDNYKEYSEYLQRFKAEEKERRSKMATESDTEDRQDSTPVQIKFNPDDLSSMQIDDRDNSPPSNAYRVPGGIDPTNSGRVAQYILTDLVSLVPFKREEVRILHQLLDRAFERRSSEGGRKGVGELTDPHKTFADKVWNLLNENAVFEADQAFKESFDRKKELSSHDNLNISSIRTLNPFHFQRQPDTIPLLQAFIEMVNPTFFFFEESELIENLHKAYSNAGEQPSQIMCELCMVLAIGSQWSEIGHEDGAALWYENGRRFLDDTNWDHEPWVMRAMALASMYHLGARPDNAQHYLHNAIRIARANDFFLDPERAKGDEAETRGWLRVWYTIMILHSWLDLSPTTAAFNLALHELGSEATPPYDDSCSSAEDGMAHRNMYGLALKIRTLSAEVLRPDTSPVSAIENHLKDLKSWFEQLPDSLRISQSQDKAFHDLQGWQEMPSQRMSIAKIHLVTMHLGATILLTSSVLLRAIGSPAYGGPHQFMQNEREIRIACTCVHAAFDLVQFSVEMVRSGLLPPKSWLSIRMAFDASMVGLLLRAWQSRLEQARLPYLLTSNKIEEGMWLEIVRNGEVTLEHCASRDTAAHLYLQNIRQLKELLPQD